MKAVLAVVVLFALVANVQCQGPFDGTFLRHSSQKVPQYTIDITTDDTGAVVGVFKDGPYTGQVHLNTTLVYEQDGAAGFINTFDPTTNQTVLQAPFSIGVSPDDGTLVGISQDAVQPPYEYQGKVFFYVKQADMKTQSVTRPSRASGRSTNGRRLGD